jgi:hypothetical protein
MTEQTSRYSSVLDARDIREARVMLAQPNLSRFTVNYIGN